MCKETMSLLNKLNISINIPNKETINTIELTNQEKEDIFESLLLYIDESCIVYIKEPNYKDVIYEECLSFLDNTIFIDFDVIDQEIVDNLVDESINYYEEYIMIPRSYFKNDSLKQEKSFVDKQINYLKNVFQPPQRTNEWYKFRHNLITASSAWKIIDTESNVNNYILNKCIPLNTEKYNHVNINSACHWGNKYEPVSVEYYEKKYNTKIYDFGCIQHHSYKNIGASPDGINVDPNSSKYGRMLEIKNIVNRDITGIPKKEYWVQMQLQMEVCNLDYCDFLECRFKEYSNEEEFLNDGTFTHTINGEEKGIILHFYENQNHIYEYAPLNISKEEFELWNEKMLIKHENTWINTIYWKLDEVSCVVVERNRKWFNTILPEFLSTWKTIEHERVNGYEHRKSKRKIKKNIVVEKDSYMFQDDEHLENNKLESKIITINTS